MLFRFSVNLLIIAAFSLSITTKAICQDNTSDSTLIKLHSPKKATWLALMPGAGQIYNKKYWKLPIVYAGFGVAGYFAFSNRSNYKTYNEAYVCKASLEDECTNDLAQRYSASQLKTLRDYYRRNMELSFILMGVWYIIQILDATVDAHLYYWNVDDNLSVKVEPVIQIPGNYNSINLSDGLPAHNGLKISVNF